MGPSKRSQSVLLVLLQSRIGGIAFLFIFCSMMQAQTEPASINFEVKRLEGVDPENQEIYVRLLHTGSLVPSVDIAPPATLTAQCTKTSTGKLGFELFANFGGVSDDTYHRRWMPKDGGLFPPATGKALVTMEFLGYKKVKPVKRQWEALDRPVGQLSYNPPSGSSSNMEDITFYLQYMKALPTLRLTYGGKTAQFLVAPLLEQIRKEPLCRASGL